MITLCATALATVTIATAAAATRNFYRVKARRSYACEWCGYQVYPTAGTPFDRTRTSLRDWFYVMFLFTTTRNGVAAKEVEREFGVTYKTAWRMCHQIRDYMARARQRRSARRSRLDCRD